MPLRVDFRSGSVRFIAVVTLLAGTAIPAGPPTQKFGCGAGEADDGDMPEQGHLVT
jgi:hypothetical protein